MCELLHCSNSWGEPLKRSAFSLFAMVILTCMITVRPARAESSSQAGPDHDFFSEWFDMVSRTQADHHEQLWRRQGAGINSTEEHRSNSRSTASLYRPQQSKSPGRLRRLEFPG